LVVIVEEAFFLIAVKWVVGDVKVDHQYLVFARNTPNAFFYQ